MMKKIRYFLSIGAGAWAGIVIGTISFTLLTIIAAAGTRSALGHEPTVKEFYFYLQNFSLCYFLVCIVIVHVALYKTGKRRAAT